MKALANGRVELCTLFDVVPLSELTKGNACEEPTARRALRLVPALAELYYSLHAQEAKLRLASHNLRLYSHAAMPYYKRVGGLPRGVKVRSAYVRGAPARGAADAGAAAEEAASEPAEPEAEVVARGQDVAVRGGRWAVDGEVWFARVLAFIGYESRAGGWRAAAYVHWYEAEDNSAETEPLHMVRLRRARHQRPYERRAPVTQDFTDLIPLEDIIEPVLLQPDPSKARRFFYNHFVR